MSVTNLEQFSLENYEQQLSEKKQYIQHQLVRLGYQDLTFNCFASQPIHYRMRAEFAIHHSQQSFDYKMFDPQTKKPYLLNQFLPGSQLINQLMPLLKQALCAEKILTHKLFQVRFLTTTTNEALVTLLYHKRLDELFFEQATLLAQSLGIQLVCRARKQHWVYDQNFITEKLVVNNKIFVYRQYEGGFTQPNAQMNSEMLNWIDRLSGSCSGMLMELYCGNGNFTVSMAQHFDKVLATELSKVSVQAAQVNLKLNAVDHVEVVRLSSEEVVEAFSGVRIFNRLKHLQLSDYKFSTLFVDPPRCGLDETVLSLAKQFDNIFYISCNPVTLFENLEILCKTHTIQNMALFDQFPFTPHIELGVYLTKKK